MMGVTIIAPPAALVTTADAKAWQPVLAADADARVTALLQAAQAAIEPPSGWVGRAFGVQTLEARFEHWRDFSAFSAWRAAGEIRLPFPPLRSVASITYLDTAGVEQTLLAANYLVSGQATASGRVRPAPGLTWPALAAGRPEAVRIRFEAGYAADDPQLRPVKQAIVLAAVHLRSLGTQDLALRSREVEGVGSRTWTVSDVAQKLIASTVESLLSPLRVYS